MMRPPEEHWRDPLLGVCESCIRRSLLSVDTKHHHCQISVWSSTIERPHRAGSRTAHCRVGEKVAALEKTNQEATQIDNPARIREHLANERTFLAWVRTGMAVVIFGFAMGRFAIPELTPTEGQPQRAAGMPFWFGVLSIGAGIALVLTGLNRYR